LAARFGSAVNAATPGSSDNSVANPDISLYVLAPMRAVRSFSASAVIHPMYSGPSMPQEPGQPSAEA